MYIPSHVLWGAGLEKQSLHMPECVHSPHAAGFRKQNRARKQTRTFMKACLHGVTSLVGVRGIEVKIDAQVSMGESDRAESWVPTSTFLLGDGATWILLSINQNKKTA